MSAARLLHVQRTNDVFQITETEPKNGAPYPVALALGCPSKAERIARELVRETNRARLARLAKRCGGSYSAFVVRGYMDGEVDEIMLREAIREGWLDFFGHSRATLAGNVDYLMRKAGGMKRERETCATDFFGLMADGEEKLDDAGLVHMNGGGDDTEEGSAD